MGRNHVNTVVIGAGVVGLAAASEATASGEVVCLEADPRPGQGSSAGESRLFRHRHSDPRLAELAARSHEEWLAWEILLGCELLGTEGHIFMTPEIDDEVSTLCALGVEARVISGEEAAERCPILSSMDPVGFDPSAGVIRAAAVIEALAASLGDRLRARSRVEGIRPLPGGGFAVRVADAGPLICEHLIIAAGDASPELAAQVKLHLPETRTTWHVRPLFDLFTDASTGSAVPTAVSDRRGVGAYLLPVPGTGRVAIGLAGEKGSIPGPSVPDRYALRGAYARLERYIRENLIDVSPTPSAYVPCRSVSLAEGEVDGSDGIAVAAAGGAVAIAGGNMFKFAPLLGRILREATHEPDSVPEVLRVGQSPRPHGARD